MTRPMVVLSNEAKRAALERMTRGEAASAIAAELGIDRQRLYAWRAKVQESGLDALRGPGRPRLPDVATGASEPAFLSESRMQELVGRFRHRSGERLDGRR